MVVASPIDTIRSIPTCLFRRRSWRIASVVLCLLLFVQTSTSISLLGGVLNCQVGAARLSASVYSADQLPVTLFCAHDNHVSELPVPLDSTHHLLHHAHHAFALPARMAALPLLMLILLLWMTRLAMPPQISIAPIPHPPQYR
jgi:hypothetical protein